MKVGRPLKSDAVMPKICISIEGEILDWIDSITVTGERSDMINRILRKEMEFKQMGR